MLNDMYVARDKDGTLWLYSEKPHREENYGVWYSDRVNIMEINSEEFPQLKWEDEPIEVKLIISHETNNNTHRNKQDALPRLYDSRQ